MFGRTFILRRSSCKGYFYACLILSSTTGIHQNIEYTAVYNRNAGAIQKEPAASRRLRQKIVLDLIIHLLQVQQVRVSYDGKGI